MLHFLIYDVLGTPAILVGLFSLIGLLLQKKGISDVISGTLKTIMGFVILTAGAGIIAYTLTIFSQLFEHSFHIQGVVPNTDAMAALAQKNYGTETATIMVLGMLINIALARLTPLKYIFLTGHHTLYMAAMLAVILSVGGLLRGLGGAIGGGFFRGERGHSPANLEDSYPKNSTNHQLALRPFCLYCLLLFPLEGKDV
ncbi:PTS ascorbate transporter subunit IIC, partial [Klebsiella pneumoniae]|nr:PTS ascorbate transporter subunit IIC [Klebsiella pneumoniae]